MADALTVARIHHRLLGTYGDAGNTDILIHRARSRGLEVDFLEVEPGEPIPTQVDVYVIGGGEDGPQLASLELLKADGGLNRGMAAGASVLAICAGFQLLGRTLPGRGGTQTDGVGIFDTETIVGPGARCVGEVVIEPTIPGMPLITGFENHQGVTTLGPSATPLGRVLLGRGNGTDAGVEGAVTDKAFGTYLHGPVLARNPELADAVLASALGELTPLDDALAADLAAERRRTLSARIGADSEPETVRRGLRRRG